MEMVFKQKLIICTLTLFCSADVLAAGSVQPVQGKSCPEISSDDIRVLCRWTVWKKLLGGLGVKAGTVRKDKTTLTNKLQDCSGRDAVKEFLKKPFSKNKSYPGVLEPHPIEKGNPDKGQCTYQVGSEALSFELILPVEEKKNSSTPVKKATRGFNAETNKPETGLEKVNIKHSIPDVPARPITSTASDLMHKCPDLDRDEVKTLCRWEKFKKFKKAGSVTKRGATLTNALDGCGQGTVIKQFFSKSSDTTYAGAFKAGALTPNKGACTYKIGRNTIRFAAELPPAAIK